MSTPPLPQRCPLPLIAGGLRSVEVTLNAASRRFLLDLGAGVSIVDTALADALSLPEVGQCTGRRMTGAEVTLDLRGGVQLELGSRVLPLSTVGAFALSELLPGDWPAVDGALTLDLSHAATWITRIP
jgi:hypothetical protein